MSWKDDLDQDFTIQTGDGKIYTVLSNKYSKTVSWNSDTFSFIGVKGQLGKKEEQLARQFPLEFYFQGPNHKETSQLFENSLNSKEPCLIKHPLYGNIVCHIFTITFSNSDTELNITKITCAAIETIVAGGLIESSPYQAIQLSQNNLIAFAAPEISGLSVTAVDGIEIRQNMEASKIDGLKIIKVPDQAKEYTNVFNEAVSLVNVITASPVIAMAATCNFIKMPGNFLTIVDDRLTFLTNQFDRFIDTVLGRVVNPASKKIFEIQAATCISTMCIAAITPIGREYTTTKSVLNIANRISQNYNRFLEVLDGLQVSSGGPNEYYIYSSEIISNLNECVNTTLSNLILIALNGKQERFVYTTEDSNVILLAHKYYGGDINDENLQYFLDTNNFTYQQMIGIKKGTKIVYYN